MQKGTIGQAQIHIDAAPEAVYAVVSDVTPKPPGTIEWV
jgi:GMP synthase PP-ATPase subunit